jgi:predicted nucleic acid-binding protein
VMTSVSNSIFLDTNILVRANVATAPLHNEVLSAFNKLQSTGITLWISRQIMREYIATVTRDQTFMKALPATVVNERIKYFETHFNVADDHAAITANLLKLLLTIPMGGKQVHDANIVATMQTYGIGELLTLNTIDFVRFAAHIKLVTLEDVAKIP